VSLRLTPASAVRAPPSANLRRDQNPNRDPDACSDHAQKQMQQMTCAGASRQNLLCAQFALPLFTLLSHYAIPHKKSTTHNPTNPITPASTFHQKFARVGSIMADRMSGGGENVKSPSRQPFRRAADQPLCSRIQSPEMTEQGFFRRSGFSGSEAGWQPNSGTCPLENHERIQIMLHDTESHSVDDCACGGVCGGPFLHTALP
jgi:hypothetical protein